MQSEHEITEAQLRREVSALKHSLADLQETNDQLTSVNAELLDRLSLEKVIKFDTMQFEQLNFQKEYSLVSL